MIPAPAALRFVCATRAPAPKRVPFGLVGWSEDAPAIAVRLDLERGAPIATACAQVPDAEALAEGTLVVLLGEGPAASSLLGRLFGVHRAPISRAARATALLARGFVRIAAAVDPASGMDLVWGYAEKMTPQEGSIPATGLG